MDIPQICHLIMRDARQVGERIADLAEKLAFKRSYWSQDAQIPTYTASNTIYKGVQTAKYAPRADWHTHCVSMLCRSANEARRWREEKRGLRL